MNDIRVARAVAGSRLADALDVWIADVRTAGGLTRGAIGLLHDLFDTVGDEVRDALRGHPAPADPVAEARGTCAALSAGLRELAAELGTYQQWSRGGDDPVAREQAACVVRRANEYQALVEGFGRTWSGADEFARRGVSGLPVAGLGRDPGLGMVRRGVFPAAARDPAGGVEPAAERPRPPCRADRRGGHAG